ncbi:MAG: UDP-N-acetylmuramoyl-tripeptide--D-alanyl-D-alanine ligase [Elusimicrobia bacterium]|nr:UDP-N-acetylmuramoyl-tripeptide--D-alanyl-D-alanine ligase [Elusimicrobiota bacterium]
MTWAEAAKAAGGRLLRGRPDAPLGSLSTDSRRLAAGQAFLALKGLRLDAHELLDEQLARAAGGWIVREGARLPAALPENLLEVPDTLRALAALAAAHRGRFDLPVAAVTGSNGKTTTKEMLRSILSRAAGEGSVCANSGSLNNEVGLPLSVLELSRATRYAVFELGASRRGDIAYLCGAAKPTLGVLTNIGPAHIEFFGSVEAVFQAKSELVEALPSGSPVVLNSDDPWLSRLLPALGSRAVAFGAGAAAQVRILEAGPGEIALALPQGRLSVRLPICGRTQRLNAAAAAAAAMALGLSLEEIREGLVSHQGVPLRFAQRGHPTGAWLLVDAYNANPDSMRAAVETFLEAAPPGERILVLGDMKELGAESVGRHQDLGRWLAGLPLSAVFLAGPETVQTAGALRLAGAAYPVAHEQQAKDLLPLIRSRLKPGASLLFKASRAMRFEEIAQAL